MDGPIIVPLHQIRYHNSTQPPRLSYYSIGISLQDGSIDMCMYETMPRSLSVERVVGIGLGSMYIGDLQSGGLDMQQCD